MDTDTDSYVSVAPCLMFEKPAAYIFSYDTSVSFTEKEKKNNPTDVTFLQTQ